MLEMPELWDTCRGQLLKGSRINPREKCVAVNKAERSWRSEEHFDHRHEAAEFGACLLGFRSFSDPIFSNHSPFSFFWTGNVNEVPLYVGSM